MELFGWLVWLVISVTASLYTILALSGTLALNGKLSKEDVIVFGVLLLGAGFNLYTCVLSAPFQIVMGG